jgi:hypothetical protein
MPGTPAMRAPSAVHKPAISSLSSGDASVSPGEAIRALGSPDLSIGSLRELAGVEQRTAPAPAVSGWSSGEAPAAAVRHLTPEPQRPSGDPDAVRIRPVGLIMLGVMFIALGVVLGVVVVRFFFSPTPAPMPAPVSPPPVSAPPSAS